MGGSQAACLRPAHGFSRSDATLTLEPTWPPGDDGFFDDSDRAAGPGEPGADPSLSYLRSFRVATFPFTVCRSCSGPAIASSSSRMLPFTLPIAECE